MEEDYMDLLSQANELVRILLLQSPYGADCGVEICKRLEEGGFAGGRENDILIYIGKKVEVRYDGGADKPFSMRLNENNSDAVSEAMNLASKLIQMIEDI